MIKMIKFLISGLKTDPFDLYLYDEYISGKNVYIYEGIILDSEDPSKKNHFFSYQLVQGIPDFEESPELERFYLEYCGFTKQNIKDFFRNRLEYVIIQSSDNSLRLKSLHKVSGLESFPTKDITIEGRDLKIVGRQIVLEKYIKDLCFLMRPSAFEASILSQTRDRLKHQIETNQEAVLKFQEKPERAAEINNLLEIEIAKIDHSLNLFDENSTILYDRIMVERRRSDSSNLQIPEDVSIEQFNARNQKIATLLDAFRDLD
jgi:hypothetical protein